MRLTTAIVWILLLAVCLAATPAPAQKNKALAHLVKDQQNLLKRLQTFTEKLDRLGKRLEGEGQTYAANLLDDAYRHLITQRLQETMDEVRRLLEAEQLFEAQTMQKVALAQLRKSLAILLDRKDLARLEAELEQMKRTLGKIDELRSEQTHLNRETRGAQDPSRASARDALKQRLDELAAEQARLMQETRGPTPDEQASWNRLKIGLDDLREQQLRLADAMQRAEQSGALERKSVRDAAAKAFEAWERELSAAAASPDGETKTAAEQNRQARETARRAAEAALDRLDRSGARHEAARRAFEKAADLEKRADAASEQGAEQAAREGFREAARAAARAAAEMKRPAGRSEADAERAKLGTKQQELRNRLKALGRELREALVPEGARREAGRASEAMENAARALQKAGRRGAESAGKTDPAGGESGKSGESTNGKPPSKSGADQSTASRPARRAADALARALDAMRKAEASRQNASRGDRKALAEREAALAQKTDTTRQAIEANARQEQQRGGGDNKSGDNKSGDNKAGKPDAPKSEAAQRTAEAAHQMRRAAEDLRAGNTSRARDRQREAHRRLKKAREALDKQGPSGKDPEAVRRALVQWQRKLREKAKALAKSLEQPAAKSKDGSPAPRGGGSRSRGLDRAERSMKRARRDLERNRLPQAEERQREAIASLNQAEREIKKRERDYIEMAQEEVIFRVAQKIRDVLEVQKKINKRSEVEGRRLKPGKRMSRSVRNAFNRLSGSQAKAAAVIGDVVTRLQKEKIEVFLFLLENVKEDMNKLTANLRQRPPDLSRLTRLMQADVERNLQALLDAFDEEGKRRRKNRGRKDGGGQQDPQDDQGRPRLVPPTAELIMLKTYEQQVFRRTELIQEAVRSRKADEPVPPHLRQLMLRLAHRQGQVREVLKKFMKSLGISTEDVD